MIKKIVLTLLFFYSYYSYGQFYNDSARVYFQKMDVTKSSYFAKEGIKYFEKNKDTLNWKYAECLLFYAGIKNDSSFSKKPLTKIIEIYKKEFGNKSLEYSFCLDVIAKIFKLQKMYDDSEYYYNELCDINKIKFGSSSLEYAKSLYYLGKLYFDKKDYKKAMFVFLKSSNIQDVVFKDKDDERDSENYDLLLFLGNTYENMFDYNMAKEFYIKGYKLNSEHYGESDISNLRFLTYLEMLCLYEKNIMKEQIYQKRSMWILEENKLQNSIDYKETERGISVNYLKINFEAINTNLNSNKELNSTYFENQIKIKNTNLRNHQSLLRQLKNNSDNELKKTYNLYISNKKEIITLNKESYGKKELNIKFEKLKSKTDSIENILNLKLESDLDIKWNKIKEKLLDNEIVIDLLALRLINNESIYSAFIIGKNYECPQYIQLFEEEQLKNILINSSQNQEYVNDIYSNKSIGDFFFKEIIKKLNGITTIYLSPAQLGNQIDFAALPINEKQTLGEKFKLHILNSSTELIDYKPTFLNKEKNVELLLYGGVNYDSSQEKSNNGLINGLISFNEEFNDLAKRSGIETLPGTRKEVENIYANANKSGFSCKVFKESDATEESIKALDGRENPYFLHIATHGFFFPDIKEELKVKKDNLSSLKKKSNIYNSSDDSMMRSGLLLAGAKNYWGKANQNNTIEDGIFTASEISNLDLSACQLVVLSACETGLGEINGSEGVYGLQRAFKMAGVKNIIMSLWKVPDAQTAELFELFYNECFTGKSIHEAFRTAQVKMKAKYSPYYWAGFVLLE